MLISLNFLVFYSLTSIFSFLKDIYVKTKNESEKDLNVNKNNKIIISDYKKVAPLVLTNMRHVLKYMVAFDLYFTMFGSNYNVFMSLLNIILGFPVFIGLYILVSDYYQFDMNVSRHNLKTKNEITISSPFLLLYQEEMVFLKLLRTWLLMVCLTIAMNEYVLVVHFCLFLSVLLLTGNDISIIDTDSYKDSNFIGKTQKLTSEFMMVMYSSINNFKRISQYGVNKVNGYLLGNKEPLGNKYTPDPILETNRNIKRSKSQEDLDIIDKNNENNENNENNKNNENKLDPPQTLQKFQSMGDMCCDIEIINKHIVNDIDISVT